MKKKLIKLFIFMFAICICFGVKESVNATTSFSTSRKSLKIYEKFDIINILKTDNKDNLKYEISNDKKKMGNTYFGSNYCANNL